jgi:DNA-directed RNA polymerase specialized sigma24 family protein
MTVDRDLVESARGGDREAYADLIRSRSDRLFAIAQRILRDVDRTEDAVQEALVIAWRDLPGLRDPDRFDAWLRRLLVRSCVAEAQRERRLVATLRVLPIDQAEYARSKGVANNLLVTMVDSPGLFCEGAPGLEGSTAAELANSMAANKAYTTTEPVTVTIGGLTGARFDTQVDPDWTGGCEDQKDERARFIFLDAPGGGKIMVIIDSIHSADFEAFVAEAMPIVESFQFDVAP